MKVEDWGTAAYGSGHTPRIMQIAHPGGANALLLSVEHNRGTRCRQPIPGSLCLFRASRPTQGMPRGTVASLDCAPFGLEEDSSRHLYSSVAVALPRMEGVLLLMAV